MDVVAPLIGSAVALGAAVLVFRFVARLFRSRRHQEPDEDGYAGVGAPLRPRTPRRAAKAAVEEPDEPE